MTQRDRFVGQVIGDGKEILATFSQSYLFFMQNYLYILFISILFILFSINKCFASSNDAAFSVCERALEKSGVTILDQKWRRPPVGKQISNIINGSLLDEKLKRWAEIKNKNGTSTIVLQFFYTDKNLGDDFYDWRVLMKDGVNIKEMANISAHGFAFSKTESIGIRNFYFCTKGRISGEWVWTGKVWQTTLSSYQ